MRYGFIIDLDGTMYAGSRTISYAADFIRRLRELRCPYVFATNNSSRTPMQVAEHLRQVCGFKTTEDEVATTAQAAAAYAASVNPGGRVYMIGEEGLRQAILEAGLELVNEEEPSLPRGHAGSDTLSDFVIQGIDRAFTYAKLAEAVSHIRAGARFILTNPDHLLPGEGGLLPGAGSLGAAIERAAGQQPIVIGKPSRIMMDFAARRLGLPSGQIWAVGDNLRTDIGGGIAAGFRTALVLTGIANADNVNAQLAETGIQPELICADLRELLERLGEIG